MHPNTCMEEVDDEGDSSDGILRELSDVVSEHGTCGQSEVSVTISMPLVR